MVDLWPNDFGVVDIRTPASILREQASKLGEKTKNVVEAEVRESVTKPYWANSGDFAYDFNILAPLLNGYRYKLFTMSYPIHMYPVRIGVDIDIALEIVEQHSDLNNAPTSTSQRVFYAQSEEEYIKLIGLVFNSAKVRNTINAILAHSAK